MLWKKIRKYTGAEKVDWPVKDDAGRRGPYYRRVTSFTLPLFKPSDSLQLTQLTFCLPIPGTRATPSPNCTHMCSKAVYSLSPSKSASTHSQNLSLSPRAQAPPKPPSIPKEKQPSLPRATVAGLLCAISPSMPRIRTCALFSYRTARSIQYTSPRREGGCEEGG